MSCFSVFHPAGTQTPRVSRKAPAQPLRKTSSCHSSAVLHPLMSAGLWRRSSRLRLTNSFDSRVIQQLNLIPHIPPKLLRTNQQLWIGWSASHLLISLQLESCPLDGSQLIPRQTWQHQFLPAPRVMSTFLKMYTTVSCPNPLHRFTGQTPRSPAST